MNWNNFIFVFSCLLILLQLITLFVKLRSGKGFFYLISICSIVWGILVYFFNGFFLEEGTLPVSEIPAYERGFQAAAWVLFTSAVSLLVNFFWRKKVE